MKDKTDIQFSTNLGILYNKAQQNNIEAEVLRCREIGMPAEIIELFETPVLTEVRVKSSYNSCGTCYGIDYLFSDESIDNIRKIYEEGHDIIELVTVRRYEYPEGEMVTVATFDEKSIYEIWAFMYDGCDVTMFMETKYGYPKFYSGEMREIMTAMRLGLDEQILLAESSTGHCKYHHSMMRAMNVAMARNLPSLKYMTMTRPNGIGFAFDNMCPYYLNYAAMNVPEAFDIITQVHKDGMAVFKNHHMFYIINAYEEDLPSKKLFHELDEEGYPKISYTDMKRIYTAETKQNLILV